MERALWLHGMPGNCVSFFIWQARSRARTKLTQWCNHHVQRLFSNSHFSPGRVPQIQYMQSSAGGVVSRRGALATLFMTRILGHCDGVRPLGSVLRLCSITGQEWQWPGGSAGETLSYFNCRESSVRQLALWGLAKRYVTGPHARLLHQTWYTRKKLYYILLYNMINDMIWSDMIWFYMIWYDVIWYNLIRYDMIWYDMTRYDMIWYDVILYDMISYHIY